MIVYYKCLFGVWLLNIEFTCYLNTILNLQVAFYVLGNNNSTLNKIKMSQGN